MHFWSKLGRFPFRSSTGPLPIMRINDDLTTSIYPQIGLFLPQNQMKIPIHPSLPRGKYKKHVLVLDTASGIFQTLDALLV
jgi:hypothetical protein